METVVSQPTHTNGIDLYHAQVHSMVGITVSIGVAVTMIIHCENGFKCLRRRYYSEQDCALNGICTKGQYICDPCRMTGREVQSLETEATS